MKPVTVALYGGAGNQMFQYAMGRAISLRCGYPLQIDTYGFEFDAHYKRKFELGHFAIDPGFRLVRRPFVFRLARIARRLSEFRRNDVFPAVQRLIVESSHAFDSRKMRVAGGAYIMGYWQDERYFSDYGDVIKREFTPVHELSAANKAVAARIRECANPVAVHVRRLHGASSGPNAAPLADAEKKGLALRPAYYGAAIKEISTRVPNPEFFVFSDYPQWARQNLMFEGKVVFLENKRGPDFEDMALMSFCRHHIICNSSFSWWGAWLAKTSGQVVIAPKNAKIMPNIPSVWIPIAD